MRFVGFISKLVAFFSTYFGNLLIRNFLRLLIAGCLFFSYSSIASDKHLLFNRPADTPQARYVIDLLSIAYTALGYEMHIIDFNHQSALGAANDGILDGQLGRTATVGEAYQNLRKVDFILFEFNLVLLKNCIQCQYKQVQSITIQSGYPAAQNYLNAYPFDGDIVRVKSVTAQLNLLKQKKVQGAVLLDFILETKHPDFNTHAYQQEILTPIESYHFLHKRHQHLVPKLAAELAKLKENGTVQILKAKYLSKPPQDNSLNQN